ncbi:conserved hypothetical protein [Burkholderia pseudomallei MSHR346]|nr:conserved hypothetical protein [Burkholderia pseudomallei MSHR346]
MMGAERTAACFRVAPSTCCLEFVIVHYHAPGGRRGGACAAAPPFSAIRLTAAEPRPHRRIRSRAPPRRGAGCNCNLQQMGVARDSGFRYIRLIRRGCRRCRYGERRRPPSGEPK